MRRVTCSPFKIGSLLVTAAVLAVTAFSQQPNHVPNGDFSQGVTGWSVFGQGGTTTDGAFRLEADGGQDAAISQRIDGLQPGQIYVLRYEAATIAHQGVFELKASVNEFTLPGVGTLYYAASFWQKDQEGSRLLVFRAPAAHIDITFRARSLDGGRHEVVLDNVVLAEGPGQ